jgi:DNA-binding winged helix-turn-helix (wHTH) protein
MKEEEGNLTYHFAGFKVSQSQQVLCKDGKKDVITTKAYYLLLTFLKNHGKILSKDDLINAVWPGQIVTDTALTKQVVRLRKIIGDVNPDNPIIETHRGVGYRFATLVEINKATDDSQSTELLKSKKRFHRLPFLVFVISITAFGFYLIYAKNKEPTNIVNSATATNTSSFNVAIVPSSQARTWYNRAGLNYLSELLNSNGVIHSINPQSEWFESKVPHQLAIDIASKKNIKYACLIDIKESESGFGASLKLRTKDAIIAKTEINDKNISKVIVKINNWIAATLSTHENIRASSAKEFEQFDNYAVESYLQGLFSQQIDSNQKKANDFFQAAVNKDDTFISAWIKLAESFVQLGNFDKAIAIGENILTKHKLTLSNNEFIKLHYSSAVAYYRIRNDEKAKQHIQTSMQYVNESSNPFVKMMAFRSLAILAFMKQDWEKAEEYESKRLALARDNYPFESYLAEIHVSLAGLLSQQNKINDAKNHLYSAMDYYQKVNNSYDMMKVLFQLSNINLHQNKLDEGVILTQKAAPYLATHQNPSYSIFFMSSSGIILNLRGLFDRSNLYYPEMESIAKEHNNALYFVIIDFLKMHQYYVQNKFKQAKIHLDTMRTVFETQETVVSARGMFYTYDMLITARAESADVALKVYDHYDKSFPQIKQRFPNEFKRALGHILVKSRQVGEGIKLLEQAENGHRALYQFDIANYVGFEILEIMLAHPETDYQPTLARISSHTKYDYLLFKLKAQFLAREGNYFNAALIMSENKQKANQLWKAEDQLLLEEFQAKAKN